MKDHQAAHLLAVVSAHIGLSVSAFLLFASIATVGVQAQTFAASAFAESAIAQTAAVGAGYTQCGTIYPDAMRNEIGKAYQALYFAAGGDTTQAPSQSKVMMFENGVAMGPGHSLHQTIRDSGAGRFSHWNTGLYFSASDSSNPMTNNRSYTWGVPTGQTCPAAVPVVYRICPVPNPASIVRYPGHQYLIPLAFMPSGDTATEGFQGFYKSPVMMFENGKALGPAHSSGGEVNTLGLGRFTHWGTNVFFSTSDNSNALTNGRTYTYGVPQYLPCPSATAPTPNGADQTTALQNWLDAQPNGATLSLPANATYIVNGTIILTNRSNLTLDGNGSTLRTASTTRTGNAEILRVIKGSNINFRNLTLDGNKAAALFDAPRQGEAGIRFFGTSGSDIGNVVIKNVGGDCVLVDASASTTNSQSSNVVIHDSLCSGASRMGIAITGGTNTSILRNTFRNVAIAVIDCEPDYIDLGCSGTKVDSNISYEFDLDPVWTGWFFIAGVKSNHVSDITVTNNVIHNSNVVHNNAPGYTLLIQVAKPPTVTAVWRNITITGNKADKANSLIDLRNLQSVTVSDNANALVTTDNVTYAPPPFPSTAGAVMVGEKGDCSGYAWRIKTSSGWIGIKETTPCTTIDFSQPNKQIYLNQVIARAKVTGNWQALPIATGAQYTSTYTGDCNGVNATVVDSWLNKTYAFKINTPCSTVDFSVPTSVGQNIVSYFLSLGIQIKDNTGGYVNENILTPTPAKPTISSFTAAPSSITAGQSSVLSWVTSLATFLSINQGVGTVTGTQKSVMPTATTTYTLSAGNAAGTTTASVVVNVKPVVVVPPASDPMVQICSSSTCVSTVGAKMVDAGGNCNGYTWRIKTSSGWLGVKETTPCTTIDFSQPNKELHLKQILTRAQTTGNWQVLTSATGWHYTSTYSGDCAVVNATVVDSWLNKTYAFRVKNSCSTIDYSVPASVGHNIVKYFLSLGIQIKDNTGGYVNSN